ncbi:MAG: hypothetical protein AB8B99_13200 [Phormidesmis sp.]
MMTSAKFSTSMEAQQAAVLLEGYHFELGHHDARQWVSLWLESYRANWIRDAVIEALYQGRYKSFSVKQILEMWQRRGQPIRHATHDFEAAVCREFGEIRLAPIPPQNLPKSVAEQKKYRSIAHSQPSSTQHAPDPDAPAHTTAPAHTEQNGRSLSVPHPTRELLNSQRSHRLQHKPNAAVSFNLSSLPPASPGMAARGEAVMTQGHQPPEGKAREHNQNAQNGHGASANDKLPSVEIRDNRDWREFPGYTTPTYSASSPDEVLRAQKQFNGVLYSSARAIQPFKPALPFSAQTLRLARQKAIALMQEAQQENIPTEHPMAELQR